MAVDMKCAITLLLLFSLTANAGLPTDAKCVAPAKMGGGFDLTCKLLSQSLHASGASTTLIPTIYQPGGIGALTFKKSVTVSPDDSSTVIAFSSGTLLNLAQGKFGPFSTSDVRWLYSLGMDYGVIAVKQDSPYQNLKQLLTALKNSPQTLIFGAGGSIGSQDWFKAALLAKAAGISHKSIRFVAYEGGGEALSALTGGHVQVLAGDAGEVGQYLNEGAKVKVLAVLSGTRLPGRFAKIPTAKEQGYDIQWPILRGVYIGHKVSEFQQKEWQSAISKATQHTSFIKLLDQAGIQERVLRGAELTQMVELQTQQYRKLAEEFGIVR